MAHQFKDPLSNGLAWANGKWLALSLIGGETSVLESSDLRTWNRVATVPTGLNDIAYGDGQWIAVGGESDNDTDTAWSTQHGRAPREGVAPVPRSYGFGSVADGNGTWLAVDNGHQGGDPSRIFESTDGAHWTLQDTRTSQGASRTRVRIGTVGRRRPQHGAD